MSRSSRAHLWFAGAGLAATLLAGCMAGPNFVAPPAPSVSRFTQQPVPESLATDASEQRQVPAAVLWWQLLQSPQLDATVQLAIEDNRDLQATRAALAQADALTRASDAALYPNVSLDAGIGREKFGAESLGSFNLPPFSYYACLLYTSRCV